MNERERDRLRGLIKWASPLPWGHQGTLVLGKDRLLLGRTVIARAQRLSAQAEYDAEYMAAAATALPTLLDQLDAAEGIMCDLREELSMLRAALPRGEER